MSVEAESRKLVDLRVVDLKNELEKRGLDKAGNKQSLVERLQKAMEEEGLDPKSYQFETDKKRLSSSQVEGGDNSKNQDDADEETDKTEINADNKEKPDGDTDAKDVKNVTNGKTKKEDDPSAESDNLIQLTLEDGESFQDEEIDSGAKAKTGEELTPSKDKPDTKDAPNKNHDAAKPGPDNSGKTQDGDNAEGNSTAVGTSNNKSPSSSSKSKRNYSKSRNLWITNIAQTTRATELKQALSAYGKVIGAKVVINAKQPGACCYGYVTMDTVEDADNCIAKLNNTELNGHTIRIEKVRPDHMNSIKMNPKLRSLTSPKRDHEKSKSAHREHRDSEKVKDEKTKDPEKDNEDKKDEALEVKSNKSKSKSQDRSRRSSQSSRKRDSNILTYAQIKEQQERQRYRKRLLQEENRRRREDDSRRREIDRMQRSEAARLEREREKLRFEREKIEREKAEIIRLERERQKLEREKLELEKLELQRNKVRLQEEGRRSTKRPGSYRREDYEERKRTSSVRRYDDNLQQMRFDPPGMGRDSRYDEQERDRSPHYIPVERNRRSISKEGMRSSRERRYVEPSKEPQRFERNSSGSNSWGHPSGGLSNKAFNAGISGGSVISSKPWVKDVWRSSEPQNPHRWNSGNMSRPTPQLSVTGFQGNSSLKLEPSCPPPPAINTYGDNRFEYKSMNTIRKY